MTFEDPDFELFDQWESTPVTWLRPAQIAEGQGKDKAVFVDDDFVLDDVDQGWLGDCWFLASIAAVIDEVPELLAKHLAQAKEDFELGSGKLRFKFFDFGEEVEVVIDDRLPCYAETHIHGGGRLLFCTSNRSIELWSALLEKAFAKFHGGYRKLNGGKTPEGIAYLTGFITQSVPLNTTEDAKLESYIRKGICCACATAGIENPRGIIPKHSYAILGCTKVGDTDLVILANPWGSNEWEGSWSDDSAEWKEHPAERQAIDKQFGIPGQINDGVFCMSFTDFKEIYSWMTFAYDPQYFKELVCMKLDFFGATKSAVDRRSYSGGLFYVVPGGIPSAVFTKESDESDLIVQVGQQGKRREYSKVSLGFYLAAGERQETPWGEKYFSVHMNESMWFQTYLNMICTGVPAGTHKIFFCTYYDSYTGLAAARVFEQIAEIPDRIQKNHKFTFDNNPKPLAKADFKKLEIPVQVQEEVSSDEDSEDKPESDVPGSLDKFIGKTVRISRTQSGINQALDAGENAEGTQIQWKDADQGADGQLWKFFQGGKTGNLTYYSLRLAMNTDLSVDCKGSGTINGTPVLVWNCKDSPNQLILVAGKRGDDEFKLRFGHTSKLIEGDDRVLIWSDYGANHQWLKITIVADASC